MCVVARCRAVAQRLAFGRLRAWARDVTRADVTMTVNGRHVELDVPAARAPARRAARPARPEGRQALLRPQVCGACTVLVDGARRERLHVPGRRGRRPRGADGRGARPPADALHPLQQAFIDHGAVQCGFCTVGHAAHGEGAARRAPVADRGATSCTTCAAACAAAPATARSSRPSCACAARPASARYEPRGGRCACRRPIRPRVGRDREGHRTRALRDRSRAAGHAARRSSSARRTRTRGSGRST